MSEKFSADKNKRSIRSFSKERQKKMLEIADEEYLTLGLDETDDLIDGSYSEERLSFYDWDEI